MKIQYLAKNYIIICMRVDWKVTHNFFLRWYCSWDVEISLRYGLKFSLQTQCFSHMQLYSVRHIGMWVAKNAQCFEEPIKFSQACTFAEDCFSHGSSLYLFLCLFIMSLVLS